jgi:shikimate dehydrogenase
MTSETRYLVGLLGEGIGHSLTPPMHMREAEHLGLDYDYRIHDLLEMPETPGDVGDLLNRAAAAGYSALNVTHPCKQLVIPYLDELSVAAQRIEAVNLVLFRDGRMIGHNTDYSGFRDAFDEGLGDLPRGRVLQVGVGGAGSATAYAILALGAARLTIVDLDLSRALALRAKYSPLFPDQQIEVVEVRGLDDELALVDGAIQATAVGMAQYPGMSFDPARLPPEAWVSEVIYRPLETELLRRAVDSGHRVLDGGLMAVGQAVDSIRLITGLEPDVARMRRHFLQLVESDHLTVGSD